MLVSLDVQLVLSSKPLSDSVARDIGPERIGSSSDERSPARLRSDSKLTRIESHHDGGKYLRIYTIAHSVTLNTVCRFCPSKFYYSPLLSAFPSRTLHSSFRWGCLCDLHLCNVRPHSILIDQKSYINFHMTGSTLNC